VDFAINGSWNDAKDEPSSVLIQSAPARVTTHRRHKLSKLQPTTLKNRHALPFPRLGLVRGILFPTLWLETRPAFSLAKPAFPDKFALPATPADFSFFPGRQSYLGAVEFVTGCAFDAEMVGVGFREAEGG
jgi:hypothetical protein